MLETTIDAVRSILKADPTLTPQQRTEKIKLLREGIPQPESEPAPPAIIKPIEAAKRTNRSVRAIHKLCAEGSLVKVKFPGRQRAAGITVESLNRLIGAA